MKKWFYITRLTIFGITSLISLVTLGLSARLLAFDAGYGTTDGWAGLALAVALFTLIAFIGAAITELVAGPTTGVSWASVEIGVLGFLWLLWLSSAGYTTSLFGGTSFGSCGQSSQYVQNLWLNSGIIPMSDAEAVCTWVDGIMACTWIAWLLVTAILVWDIVLLSMALRMGHTGIWTSALWMYDPHSPPMGKQYAGPAGGMNAYPMHDQGQGHVAPSHFAGQQAYQQVFGGNGGNRMQPPLPQYAYAGGAANLASPVYSQPQYGYGGQPAYSGRAAEV